MPATTPPTAHYRRPGWFTQHVFNRFVAWLTRRGVSVWGSRVLEVPGRRTGEPRRVPVNLLTLDGIDYLVSPRAQGQWVRNVRANDGRLDLLLGRHRTHHVAHELADADKVDVLRAYLRRWKFEVGQFFDGVDADSTDEVLLARAPSTRCSASMLPAEPTARPLGTPRSARAREIIDAAFAILDDEGADALTMRRLARRRRDAGAVALQAPPRQGPPGGRAHRGHLLRRRRRPPRRPRRPRATAGWCAACSPRTARTRSRSRTATGWPRAAASGETSCRSASRSGPASRSSSRPATRSAARPCGASPTAWSSSRSTVATPTTATSTAPGRPGPPPSTTAPRGWALSTVRRMMNARRLAADLVASAAAGGAAVLVVASPAAAHDRPGTGRGLDGLLHPLTGPDHLLAMLAVRVLAVVGGASGAHVARSGRLPRRHGRREGSRDS